MDQKDLIPHLFRQEFGRITSVLCRHFGMERLGAAEDIAGDTFLAALETWPRDGIPANPSAWLYTVAKNKAKNHLIREGILSRKIRPQLGRDSREIQAMEIDLSETNISDSQLQMLFAICSPVIPEESQIGLALRILCGFGIDEIADAFLTNREVINKRLYRARESLRKKRVAIVMPPPPEIEKRMESVLTILYLLFNEGYYSEHNDEVIRRDLCLEAMRLTRLLVDNGRTDLPAANALLALMCFHSSRLEARKGKNGMPVLYDQQDQRLWSLELIAEGGYYLHRAARGNTVSKYHLEASIAYWHTIKEDSSEKWENILRLFDQLLLVAPSPVASLNRIYALSRVRGNARAIREAEALEWKDSHYYHILLGTLYGNTDPVRATWHLNRALTLAKTTSDRHTILERISAQK